MCASSLSLAGRRELVALSVAVRAFSSCVMRSADGEHDSADGCERGGVEEAPCGVGDGEEDADDDAEDEVADSINEPEGTEAPAADRHVFGSERAASIATVEVPGIGSTTGERWSSHASASCAGVTASAWAIRCSSPPGSASRPLMRRFGLHLLHSTPDSSSLRPTPTLCAPSVATREPRQEPDELLILIFAKLGNNRAS